MASFLKKLRSGDSVVDNNLPPDSCGTIIRRIIKSYAAQPPEELGIKLSADAEVVDVCPGSLGSQFNIPTHFMIFEVNNMFVEDSRSFFEKCRGSLTLTIKLYSLGAVSELIANILFYEEKFSGEELRNVLKLDELMRSNPRFKFLSSDHPIFRRYTRRLQEKREASALIKQRVEEAKEQEQKEVLEKIKKAQEEEQHTDVERTAVTCRTQPVVHLENDPTPFIAVCDHGEDTFTRIEETESENVENEFSQPVYQEPLRSEGADASATADKIPIASKEELLALVGLGENSKIEITEVNYVILPSEEYVLKSGEKVVHALKKRNGPAPSPPLSA